MLRIPIEQVRVGMVLARSVYNPKKPLEALLKAGYQLDEQFIHRLRELRVGYLWVRYPNLDFLDKLLDPELTHQKQDLYGNLKEEFSQHQDIGSAKINYGSYVAKVKDLFSRLLDHHGKAAQFANDLQGHANDIFRHGATVAYLSLIMGIRLESYLVKERSHMNANAACDLTPLGLGCLLHDIGKLCLPAELQHFRMSAQNRGTPEWQTHTDLGFEMVQGQLDSASAQIILNHHQHFDGSGFPNRRSWIGTGEPDMALSGSQIHVFCRIATVANCFDTLRYAPDGIEMPTALALRRMKNPTYMKWFDPIVFEVFLESVPPYPLGEQVTLSDGRVCVVTEIPPKDPYHPIVRPIDLGNAVGEPGSISKNTDEENQEINLTIQPQLSIIKVGDFPLPQETGVPVAVSSV